MAAKPTEKRGATVMGPALRKRPGAGYEPIKSWKVVSRASRALSARKARGHGDGPRAAKKAGCGLRTYKELEGRVTSSPPAQGGCASSQPPA